MAKLFLVRHGTTKLHANDRFWGKTDVPLSSIGIKQAGQLRERLAAEKVQAIFSSTSSRARSTAEIIAAGHRPSVAAYDELCECNFGFAEGLTYSEIEKVYPALAKELAGQKAVTFPGGESLAQLNDRVKAFLPQLAKFTSKDNVIIVAHGGPLRLIICNLLGLGLEHWQQFRIDRASVSIIVTFPPTAILNSLNDVAHLKT